MIDDETRELLHRAERVCSDYVDPRIAAGECIADSQRLCSDITDYLTAQATINIREKEQPPATSEASEIATAIDRQTASNHAWNIVWQDMRLVENARSIRISELWELHEAREQETHEQRQADRKRQERLSKGGMGRWFLVDGKPCRFEHVIGNTHYAVRGEDRVFHQILIEGAQECNPPSHPDAESPPPSGARIVLSCYGCRYYTPPCEDFPPGRCTAPYDAVILGKAGCAVFSEASNGE